MRRDAVKCKIQGFYEISSIYIAFTLDFRRRKKSLRNGWITQGIRLSSQKLRFLKMKKQSNLIKDAKMYIAKYTIIHRRVIREAKRRENDKYILHANDRSKAVWQIINKENGISSSDKQDIKIIWSYENITNPENVAEIFNSYFCKILGLLSKKNGNRLPNSENEHLKTKESTKSMFLFPVIESEVEKVLKVLKNRLSAGIGEIPIYIVKQCIKPLKKLLANVYNASLESRIIPDQLKVANILPLYEKEDTRDTQDYKPIALLSACSKLLEKLVYNRLLVFIEGNGILAEAQHQPKQHYRYLLTLILLMWKI